MAGTGPDYVISAERKEDKMKLLKKLAAFSAALVLSAGVFTAEKTRATTVEDVLQAARDAGFSESYVQQGASYISMKESEKGSEYTSAQYDRMIEKINQYKGHADDAIREYLGGSEPSEPAAPEVKPSEAAPSAPDTPSAPVQENQSAGNSGNSSAGSSQENTVQNNAPSQPSGSNFSEMTREEQDRYIAGMTQAEKNQILKELSRDKQLEIINEVIEASSDLGMNVSLDGLSKDKIEYSIRNENGDVVDISAMGVVIDDTGYNYTVLYIGAAAVLALCAGGFVLMAYLNRGEGAGK